MFGVIHTCHSRCPSLARPRSVLLERLGLLLQAENPSYPKLTDRETQAHENSELLPTIPRLPRTRQVARFGSPTWRANEEVVTFLTVQGFSS
ncbi:hypothetical protein Agabi119p4_7043 [Agaricus bisporus var. burnettii]|uniref:Uncharacterized protein n=1 Tax=Agaricus bisporus var. burnettii TaxID=192524 RepID=A0A8H7F0N9_AGABI|nr:hypothetical protein Agabi119p4_7043 [Agaricus bisporus var. burnettii]